MKSLPQIKHEQGKALIQLVNSWLNDDSEYDERTWPTLKKAIEEDRLSSRKRFTASCIIETCG